MNILLVHCKYRMTGGEDTVVSCDRRLLEEMGHKVSCYICSNEELAGMDMQERMMTAAGYISSSRAKTKYTDLIRSTCPDVIWVHNTLWMISTALYEAAGECGIPVIQTVHNYRLVCPSGILYREDKDPEGDGGSMCKECIHKGLLCSVRHKCYRDNAILSALIAMALKRQRRLGIYRNMYFACLSGTQKKILLDAGIGIDPHKVFIKRNHIYDLGHSDEECVKDEGISYKDRRNLFVYAGRLEENKGIKELLGAWLMLDDSAKQDDCDMTQSPDCARECPELVIMGEGSLVGYVKEFIKDHHLEHVRFSGHVGRAEVRHSLAEAKALIYPSKWYEGQPMTITESYACHTPVIVSDIGNAADMVDEGVTGMHADHRNLAEGIRDIVSRWDEIFSYNKEAIEEKAALYSPKSAVETTAAILDDITKA